MAAGPWNKQSVGGGVFLVPLALGIMMIFGTWAATQAIYHAFPEFAPRTKRGTNTSKDTGKIPK